VTQKALSLKQPWAALLAHGWKTIEVRRWTTRHKGQVLIHAAREDDERARVPELAHSELRQVTELRGGIIGVGNLREVKPYRSREEFVADRHLHFNDPSWFEEGLYGFCFEDLVPVRFIPEPGYFRLFTVDLDPQEIQRLPAIRRPGKKEPEVLKSCSSTVAQCKGPGLLVSVRSADEAKVALAGGAALIDVKEPSFGSLGPASDRVRAQVKAVVTGRRPMSVALGELRCGLPDPAPDLEGVAFAKWGLAGCAERDWQGLLRQAREWIESRGDCQLVVAAYADRRRADAPAPQAICDFAIRERVAALLLDTGYKVGSTLLDWLSVSEVADLCASCKAAGVRVALAGSLGRRQIERLLPLRPDWFAVRGAVCVGGRREGSINETLVRELVSLTQTTPAG
jgi:uncharacterized protein (UPF0264 family)